MDLCCEEILHRHIDKTLENLHKNNMDACFLPRAADVPEKVSSLIAEGASVSCGGSATLAQCGVSGLLRSGRYHFIDRTSAGTPEEKLALEREALSADVFITSSNAVTENGELYNVDGHCNRIGALCFGPASVLVIAGVNKLVPDLSAAVLRVKRAAAPANAARFDLDTYCRRTGECISISQGRGCDPAAGCQSPQRICASYLVTARQQDAARGRIKVILVGEPLGF